MQFDLHIEQLETERRWNRVRALEESNTNGIRGRFLAFRDDNAFILLSDSGAAIPTSPFVRSTKTLRLVTAKGSTITEPHELARISESLLLELRQYRIVPGARDRFSAFLCERTMDEQLRCGMPTYGPFHSLDDENAVVWFRGFPDLYERDRRKAAFYQGGYWLALESEALAMIEDYSNVMLVMPAGARA